MYQLESDEVILLAGCTPPKDASRYFSATPYLFNAFDAPTNKWITIFGSMGDSASIYQQPGTKIVLPVSIC